jgi:hypothetical protein
MTKRRRKNRRRPALPFQERLNSMWPEQVRLALQKERAGESVSIGDQMQLLALCVGALQSQVQDNAAVLGKPAGRLVVKLVAGRLRVYRHTTIGDETASEYIGDLGFGEEG